MPHKISIAGIDLQIEERGQGRPLLFLHHGEGLGAERPWLDALAARYRVIAPNLPGWGGSDLPPWLGSVEDLAYLTLDMAEAFEMQNAVMVGNSFGGWVAAEALVRDPSRFSAASTAAEKREESRTNASAATQPPKELPTITAFCISNASARSSVR